MRTIAYALGWILVAPLAEASVLKSIDGSKLSFALKPEEFVGITIGRLYEIRSKSNENLGIVKLESIVKGKGVVTRVIERSALLEVQDIVTLVAVKGQDKKVGAPHADDGSDEEDEDDEELDSETTTLGKKGIDFRLAVGSRTYSYGYFTNNDISAVELRVAYRLAPLPLAIGLNYKSDSQDTEASNIQERSIDVVGLTIEAEYFINKIRFYVLADYAVGGTAEVKDRSTGVVLEQDFDVESIASSLGIAYQWSYVYLGMEYQIANSTEISGHGIQGRQLKSSGGSLALGVIF